MRHLLWLTLAVQLSGQSIRVTNLDTATPLNGDWLMQTGDDPRYADPNFDDSAWTRVTMPHAIAPGAYGYTWHRIHLEIPTTDRPLAIAIAPHFPAYEIFAGGVKIGSFGGDIASVSGQYFARPASFALPRGKSRIVVAIRAAEWRLSLGMQSGSSAIGTSWLGTPDVIQLKLANAYIARLEGSGWLQVLCAGLGFGGLFFVMLGISKRGDREFLWCGTLLLSAMMNRLYQIPDVLHLDSRALADLMNSCTQSTFLISWVFLLSSLFSRRPTFWVWITAGAVIGGQVLHAFEISFEWLRANSAQIRSLSTLLYIFLLPLTYFLLGWWRRRPPRSEWITHITLIAYLATNSIQNTLGFFDAGFSQMASKAGGLELSYVLMRSPILLMFFAMGLVLSKRKASTEREQARLQQELSAAAQVQSLLLPGTAIEGVDATYIPASEVGGDFYQILDHPDGSRVVLVGDVSGKGLKAAMLVSVAIGALRRERSSSPAEILTGLNGVLLGQGGFVTCCCTRYTPGGELTVASAGHPAPYCDGREIEVAAGLPLGMVADAEWRQTIMHLAVGAQVTLVSDGVIEAENPERELFGFERTREISGLSAREIAEAARAWGQNDDITVVKVRRAL